jgi:hypothetical protein
MTHYLIFYLCQQYVNGECIALRFVNARDSFFWDSLKDRGYNSNPQTEEQKENRLFIGKFQIFLQNSFCGQIRMSSASVRNVYL